jgi:endonuclease III
MPRESLAKRRARTEEVVRRLRTEYPDARCSLDFDTPWQLVVATALSAQCTDERVNRVTPELFRRWPGPAELAVAPLAEIEEVVRPTGFYRNKARNIQGAAQVVLDDFGGEVPRTMPELLRLPGVARKTANVVLHVAFGAPEGAGAGIVVDTHVTRVSNRLGLVADEDPRRIEAALQRLVPEAEWGRFTHLVIDHGREVCTGRGKPRCDRCVLADLCPSAFRF